MTVPADASVGVGRSLPFPDDFENNIVPERSSGELKGGEKMSADEKGKPTEEKRDVNPTGVASAASPVNEDEIRAAAQRKERQRCTDINALCDKFDIESEQRSKWINDGTNVETVNRELLEVLSTRNSARVSVKPEMGAAEEDKLRAAYRDGLALRAGIAIAKPADGAEKMRGMSQRDIARDILMRAGEKDVLQLNADELFVRAMSSSTYSDLLNATVKLSMSQGYAEVDTTFEAWTVEGTLSDFKTAYRYKLGGAQEPELIPENGEFTHAKLDKEKTAVQLGTASCLSMTTWIFWQNSRIGLLQLLNARSTVWRTLLSQALLTVLPMVIWLLKQVCQVRKLYPQHDSCSESKKISARNIA